MQLPRELQSERCTADCIQVVDLVPTDGSPLPLVCSGSGGGAVLVWRYVNREAGFVTAACTLHTARMCGHCSNCPPPVRA
ncbi:hypothetical protein EON66_06875 [archaeon]|nr:MAG: hypothetical protein EON66_06875 [archaeon]